MQRHKYAYGTGTIDDARGLDRVEHHGEHVTMLRYKTPAAVLGPISWYESAQAAPTSAGPGPDRTA